MKQPLLSTQPMVLAQWKTGKDKSTDLVTLLITDGLRRYTETFDLDKIDRCLQEHQQPIYHRDTEGKLLPLNSITLAVLAPCLQHCREQQQLQ